MSIKTLAYQKDRPCPKCGETGASTAFRRARDSNGSYAFTDEKDRLGRTCQNCHFEWYEWPLDAGEEATDGRS